VVALHGLPWPRGLFFTRGQFGCVHWEARDAE
jgi:hypothetical protein